MSTDPSKQLKLGFLAGLVSREKSMAFERILFRATRGNVFLKQTVIEDSIIDPVSGEKVFSVSHSHVWLGFAQVVNSYLCCLKFSKRFFFFSGYRKHF